MTYKEGNFIHEELSHELFDGLNVVLPAEFFQNR